MTSFQSLENTRCRISNHWKRWACVAFLAVCSVALAAEPATTNALPLKLSGTPKRLGSVAVDAASRTVVTTGFVETVSGVLDLLACGSGGKRYESVLVLELNPLDLQTALLLVGAKAGEPMKSTEQGPPKGSPVKIWVEWTTTNSEHKVVAAEDLLWNHRDGKPVKTDWIFNGSVIGDGGRFGAQVEESFVATRWDPLAIVNIGCDLGANYTDVFVNTNTVPPAGTSVKMYFQAQ